MMPFDYFLVFLGGFTLFIGAVATPRSEEQKSFMGGMMLFGIVLIGIAMWRIS